MKTCYDLTLQYAKGKKVLDIGSCGNQGFKNKSKTLFNLLKEVCSDVTGIDIEGDGKEILKGNAETFNLDRKFELINAGDVIEHLHNAGLFLDNMKRHLKDDGIILIGTPNASSLVPLIYDGSFYHTCWYCKQTLTYLLEQHGFNVLQVYITIRKRKNIGYNLIKYAVASSLFFVCKVKSNPK